MVQKRLYKTGILLVMALVMAWPFFAAAQYYIPQNKKDTSQTGDDKPKSFFNYYFPDRKNQPAVEQKKETSRVPSIVKTTSKPVKQTPPVNVAEPVPNDPRNQQWMKEGQALSAKIASSSGSIGNNFNPAGECSAEEAKAFDSIASNFNQVTHERNAGDKERTSLNMARYLEKPGNSDKMMYLYMKCGNRVRV